MNDKHLFKSPLFYNISANIGLILGNIAGYWNFSTTMICYIYEILLLTILGAIYYMHPKRGGDPATLLMSGGFIILICFLFTYEIGSSIGEIPAKQSISDFFQNIWHIWPILFIMTIALFVSFFELERNKRELAMQTSLFYRIFLTGIVIGIGSLATSWLNESAKLIIILSVVSTRLLLEYYLNPAAFKNILKKK